MNRSAREQLSGHKGTQFGYGSFGFGKSTIANRTAEMLHQQGLRAYILDGDIRHGLSKDLGFTDADRIENIRRIGEVAKLMLDAGLIVITAFISPFRAGEILFESCLTRMISTRLYQLRSLLQSLEIPKGSIKKPEQGLCRTSLALIVRTKNHSILN